MFCAMDLLNTTEDSSPCNSTPMNLQSARDRLRDCRADAKREQEGRRSERTEDPTERLQDDYQQALKLGEVLVAYTRVMMIGAGGVGKSSFLQGLMNKRLPQHAESTILADTKTVKPFWAKAGESADGYWAEVTEEDEIQELAGLVQLVAQVKSGHSTSSRVARILTTMAAATAVVVFKPLGFIPHKASTAGDEYVSSIKDNVVRNVLEQALQHTHAGNPSIPQSEVLMHVWDCGGQPVFLDVLPAFLTSRTMFLLFFDGRRDLLSNCETLSHRHGIVVSTTQEGFTVLQLLMQWMACIHVTLSRENVKAESSNASDSQNNVKECHHQHKEHYPKTCGSIISKFPRIIPVGTHGDDPAVKERESNILDTLRSHCEDKAFAHLLLPSVIVDNTTAGKQPEDPGFKAIREEVHKFANNSLAIPTPIAWVLFRKVLQKVAKDNPIVPYEQAIAVGEACGITVNVLPSVLHFYHELAVFLHYTQIESLSQFIITDPQWLIKKFGNLLAPEELQQEVSNQALRKPLQVKGVLVQPLYEEVWRGSGLQPQALADLLEHFCLAALIDPRIKVSSFPGREYFIPSVLQSSSQSADTATEFVKKSSPLHLTFSTQYVPPGFFTRLATTISKESKCRLLFHQGIFRNKISFAYGGIDKIDEFTIFEHSSSVQITALRTQHRKPHIPTFGRVCRDIMKLIQACSATIRQWLPSIKVKAVLCCQQYPDPSHFIPIPAGATTDSILRCQHNHNSSLTRDQQYWMKVSDTPQKIMQKGDFNDAELKCVADEVKRAGKLKELADELEMIHMLKLLENAPLTLLQRWHCEVESELEAHSLLVHHLKCIKMPETSHKLYYRELLALSDPSTTRSPSTCPPEDEKEPLSLSDIIACCRCIIGDLSLLAAALDIPDEEMAAIKSKYKTANGQALQMLKKWQSTGTHTKQELAEILQNVDFPQASQCLRTTATQHESLLRDLITNVHTTKWYHLGLQLDLHDFKLQEIEVDVKDNNDRLRKMFQTWLENCVNPSWKDVVKALEKIGDKSLAAKLEKQFCK